jgi:RNA polymerase sigma factor (sigma-70 family)
MKKEDYRGLGDLDLIRLTKASDPIAFSALAEKYRPTIESCLRRRLGEYQNYVPDCCQNVLLKMYKSIQKQESESFTNFMGWVIRVSKNEALDQCRHSARKRCEPIEVAEKVKLSQYTPEAMFEVKERNEDLQKFLNSVHLTNFESKVTVLRLQDFSFKEIAIITSAPLSTCRSSARIAVGKLRNSLKNRESVYSSLKLS